MQRQITPRQLLHFITNDTLIQDIFRTSLKLGVKDSRENRLYLSNPRTLPPCPKATPNPQASRAETYTMRCASPQKITV